MPHATGHRKTARLTDTQRVRFLAEWHLLPRTPTGKVEKDFMLMLCRKWNISKQLGTKLAREMNHAAV